MFKSIYASELKMYYDLRYKTLSESAIKHEARYLKRFDKYLNCNVKVRGSLSETIINNWIKTVKGKKYCKITFSQTNHPVRHVLASDRQTITFNVDGQYMFPILFVTIACGAVSGFHSLVSSGTASKQIKSEKNMLPVSFGAMLMESMLAVIALIAVASFATGEAAAQGLTTQPQIFAGAIANFLSVAGLPHSLVFTLINLAVSAFALTSLDSVARVGRLSFQEFFLDDDVDEEHMSPFLKVVTNKYFATIITLVLAYMLTKVGYAEIWPLFGSANQLLSVLALVACAVFLKKTKRQGWMLWGPMVFMMAVTFTALGMTIVKLSKAFMTTGLTLGNTLQLVFAVLLLILGVLVAIQGVKKLLEKSDDKVVA